MTPQKAVELYYKVPQELRDKGHRTIVFQDVYNPQDSYWRKTYKNFNGHSYATSGDEIVFWRYDYPHNEQYVVRTFCHEMTHKLDKALSQTTLGRFSMEQEWQDAMSKDLTATSIASITNYGENSPLEDFAESVAVYITDNSKMLPLSHRSAIIKRLLGF